MNVRLLIDAVMRETTVLIAQLATSGGLRAPLSHVAGQVFADLAAELEREGVTKKVSADMFGLALRTYQRRTQRLRPSQTDRGRSLWEAVLEHIAQGELVTRAQVLARFRRDDPRSVRGVLRDLTDSGLVFATGKGSQLVYRVTTADELGRMRRKDRDGAEAFVWSLVFRDGPITVDRLVERTRLDHSELEALLADLVATGRAERIAAGGDAQYRSRAFLLGFDDIHGWEASVQDHFATVVRTITRKLRFDARATRSDEVGGSTYHFEIWRGHPLEDAVLGELRRFRERMSALRAQVDGHNRSARVATDRIQVDAYYGQSIVALDDDGAAVGRDDGNGQGVADDAK